MGRWRTSLAACRFIVPYRSRAQVLRSQSGALRRLLAHAYRRVPFYREAFDRAGVRPEDIRTAADLPALPVVTKDELRAAPVRETLARGLDPERLVTIRTSGTLGEPFTVYSSRFELSLLMLSWFRPFLRYGRRPRDRMAVLQYMRSHVLYSNALSDVLRNALGAFPKLNIDMCWPAGELVAALRHFRPDILAAYPGVLLRVAEAAGPEDLRRIRPRVICVGGEVITDAARRAIRQAFGAQVYNCYASEEMRLIAWECPQTGAMHTMDDTVILEVLKDGRPAAEGERGEVVVTGLHSYSMPFIRYRLGDVVTKGADVCACGLPYSTIGDVQGRLLDQFLLPDGRLLHPYDIARVLLETTDWIWSHQIVQERRDRIVLYAVPRGRPSPDAVRGLERRTATLLGPEVEFGVVLVDRLPPAPSGKLQYARSLVGRGADA
ncbi:MAG: phenylacetate--CoA ligase family protein [Candidatus Brocadiaceae bacterium]|nr:phenylacetate--CoA ligase family protein [Candidatus Brocadiaceae bacterium]